MATYATDRTAISIPFTDTTSGNVYGYELNDNPPEDDSLPSNGASGQVKHLFPWYDPTSDTGYAFFRVAIRIPVSHGSPVPPAGTGTWNWEVWSEVTIVPGGGGAVAYAESMLSSGTLAAHAGTFLGGTFHGTLNYTVVCAEYLTTDYLSRTESVYYPTPDDPDALPYPITNGNAMPDSIPARKAALFLEPVVGQTVTISATVDGAECSTSLVWSSGLAFYLGAGHNMPALGNDATGFATAAPTVMGLPLWEGSTFHYEGGGRTFDTRDSLSVTSNTTDGHSSYLDCSAELPTRYRMRASLVGSDGAPWASALTVDHPGGSQSVTGSGSWDVVQRSYQAVAYRGPLSSPVLLASEAVDEKGWMTAALSQSSLAASHLDRRDWRLQIKTFRVPGLTISHDATRDVSTGATASLSLSGGEALWGGYRYLERRVTAPAGRKVTVTVYGGNVTKTFEATKTIDGAEWVRFDLCSPANAPTGDVWKRDSRYPLRPQPTHADSPVNSEPDDDLDYLDGIAEPPGGTADETNQTWFMGVYDAASAAFSIASEEGDDDPTWGDTRLVRVEDPKITLYEGFCGQSKITGDGIDALKLWPLSADGGRGEETGAVYGAPFCYAHVDGRLVYDIPGNGYRTFAAGGYEWAYDSVDQLGANLNHYPGWHCVVSTAPPNFYGLSPTTAFANLLGGEGSDHDGLAWTHHIDEDLGDVPIQDQYDWVWVWPGAGDAWAWGHEEGDLATVVAVAKILGVRSQGFVFKNAEDPNAGKPVSGAAVWNRRTDQGSGSSVLATFGTATSASDGSYSSSVTSGPVGSPPPGWVYDGFEGGDETGFTILQSGSFPQEESRFRSRWIKRTAYRTVLERAGKVLAFLSRGAGDLYRILDRSGSAYLGTTDVPNRQDWTDRDLGEPVEEASLQRGKGDRILSGLLRSGSVTVRVEGSEGRTAPVTTMNYGTATSHDLATYGDGTHVAARIDGGTVKLSVHHDRTLTLVLGPYDTNVTGLPDDATISIDDARESGNKKILIVMIGSGGDTETYATTDLQTLTP